VVRVLSTLGACADKPTRRPFPFTTLATLPVSFAERPMRHSAGVNKVQYCEKTVSRRDCQGEEGRRGQI